jgi:hypothetical protein
MRALYGLMLAIPLAVGSPSADRSHKAENVTVTDTLADLGVSCIDGDIARWDGTAVERFCGTDQDTWLSAEDVRTFVGQSSIDLPSGSTMGGVAILSAGDTTVPD